jgi:chitinase
MFGSPFYWPRQVWSVDPAPVASAAYRPASINSVAFLKRDQIQEPLTVISPANDTEGQSPKSVCHIDANSGELNTIDLNYDDLHFEDLYGNSVDGRACDIIYDDNLGEVRFLIDENGNVQDVVQDIEWNRESPLTRMDIALDATSEPARPTHSMPTIPASTSFSGTSTRSMITPPPGHK